jgi:hypothetical protein
MSTLESYSPQLLAAARQMGCTSWYFQEGLLREDDIWLASYPRSGSHFVRFILVSARYYLRRGQYPGDLSGMKSVPDIHNGCLDFAEGPPRILKTHFPFDPRYRHLIHLIRDPRDVIVSYFHYSKGLPQLFLEPVRGSLELPQFVELFLHGKVWPGDIRAHTASYAAHARDTRYTCIRYEQLLAEPHQEYRRLLQAAGIDFPAEALDALIAHTRFENMRRLHHPVTARAGMIETNAVYILRSGTAGGYAKVLCEQMRARIESDLASYLEEYGYR